MGRWEGVKEERNITKVDVEALQDNGEALN